MLKCLEVLADRSLLGGMGHSHKFDELGYESRFVDSDSIIDLARGYFIFLILDKERFEDVFKLIATAIESSLPQQLQELPFTKALRLSVWTIGNRAIIVTEVHSFKGQLCQQAINQLLMMVCG